MRHSEKQIPGKAEWAGYENDRDAQHAHGKFYGKSIEQAQRLFYETDVLSRAEDLHFMPRAAFQYYIFVFALFLLSDQSLGDPDAASSFLRLLIVRESEERGCVADVYAELKPSIDLVSSHQARFDADLDIYGSFEELAARLRYLYEDRQSGSLPD